MKRKTLLITTLILTLSASLLLACGNAASSPEAQPTIVAETSQEPEVITTPTKEATPESTATPTKEATPEPTATPTKEATPEPTPTPTPTPTPKTSEKDILDKAIFIFSGKTNESYSDSSLKQQLTSGSATDKVAITYACDDTSHGGWGVLGMRLSGSNNSETQVDINAYTDNPDKERTIVYTVQELMDLIGISKPSQFTSFQLGAWNGGRIAGLYYLKDDVSTAYDNFLNAKDETIKNSHTYTGSLSNKNAIDSAQKVYDYLKTTYGNNCITGQMESTWMGSADYEMNYIYDRTGKYPAIRGLDFMNNDFKGVTKRAKEWWEKGGIVTICWHTGADFSSSYTECLADDINWDEAFIEGSDTYNKLITGMDRAVPYLKELNDAGVPVLWRPFHEFDGKWFWWGKGGADNFVKLWQLMYDRYTNYWGLNNLIWVLGYSSSGLELDKWYPGDAYVDIIGADSYTDGANNDLFKKVDKQAADGMPVTFHECGKIPTAKELQKKDTKWLYFMTWHTEYLTDKNSDDLLKEVYTGDYFITLDELPSFK